MSIAEKEAIAKMMRELYDDSHHPYSPTDKLVFGSPLPQQPYFIDPGRFRHPNGPLKAVALSLTPAHVECIPRSIVNYYPRRFAPTMFRSVPRRLKLMSDYEPIHKPKDGGPLGEFLQPAIRPLMEGDDKEVLAGTKFPAASYDHPCSLCYGHPYLDCCHNFPTVLLRLARLRDINYTLYVNKMHQICPSCMKREYGHYYHEDCAGRLSCSFCRETSHDSCICTSSAHVSSLGDRFMNDPFSRSQISEFIRIIDEYKAADFKFKYRDRKREILMRLACISGMLGLKVFPEGSLRPPLVQNPVFPRYGLNEEAFKPVSLERAKKDAGALAKENLPREENRIEEIVMDNNEDIIHNNDEIASEQAEPVVAGNLPQQDHIANNIADIMEDVFVQPQNAPLQAEPVVAGNLPQQDNIANNIAGVLEDLIDEALNAPMQVFDATPLTLPLQEQEIQSASDSVDGVMNHDEYASYMEQDEEDELDPGNPVIKDLFKENEDEDGPDI